MRKYQRWIACAGLTLLMFSGAYAAQQTGSSAQERAQRQGQEQGISQMQMGMHQMQAKGVSLDQASKIIGSQVTNAQNEKLGEIKDLVLDPQRTRIEYAVLSHGGFAGLGEKYVAVPWSAFSFMGAKTEGMQSQMGMQGGTMQQPATPSESQEQQYGASAQQQTEQQGQFKPELNISKEQFDKAQTFSGENWPNQASQQWNQPAQAGEQQEQQIKRSDVEKKTFETRKVSKLLGLKVETTSGLTGYSSPVGTSAQGQQTAQQQQAGEQTKNHEIGQIKDVVLNCDNGHLFYGIVSLQNVEGHSNEQCVVPWKALRIESQPKEIAQLQKADVSTLLAFAYQPDQEQQLANRSYLQRIYQAYDLQPQWEVLGFVPASGEQQNQMNPNESRQQEQQTPQEQQQRPGRRQY